MKRYTNIAVFALLFLLWGTADAQIGKRFPSEKKVVKDPVTGTMLTFLTSTPTGDSKIYQTHNQWTSDGQWLIFRSGRVRGEAMAVNEKTGEMVQVTEGGYTGMLSIARYSMKLYFMRSPNRPAPPPAPAADRGDFVGSCHALLPHCQLLIQHCWIVACLIQRYGPNTE